MASDPITQMMRCEDIQATDATQVRTRLYKEVIDNYREEIENGAKMPAITAFCEENSERIILSDGHHRLYAHIHAGREEIEVDLRVGDKHDALEYALQANRSHGLRMTNADKVKSVKMALADTELAARNQQEIADICNVTRQTVNRISRRETLDDNEQEGVTKLQEPEENKPENNRPTKTPPTQQMVDRDELRQAMSLIRAFPYGGDDTERLALSQDDIADVNYCIDWLTQALEAHVAAQYEPGDLRGPASRVATEQ